MIDRNVEKRGLVGFVADTWVPSVICLISLAFVVEALSFRGDAGKFPIVVGTITAILATIELIVLSVSHRVRKSHPSITAVAKKISLTVWFLCTLTLFYVIGILATIAISGSVYFAIFVGLRVHWAVLTGLGHAAFFWIAFELLAGFRLYEGIF